MEAVICVEKLGKKYVIGDGRGHTYTLRETISAGITSAFGLYRLKHKQREEFWALRDASLEVRKGEVVGIIGANGAGKSTFLKLLSRITEPTTGTIEFRGRIASLLEVGTGFHPELSGRENIFLNGAILGMPKEEIRRKFDEIVAFAEIDRFLDTPVKRYSSGMYMRLAFVIAAHLDADILLVDEVLAVGDSAFQRKCLGKMQEVASEGARTVVFVSHNMQAVVSLCSRTVHFDHGKVVEFGRTAEVVRRYLGKTGSLSSEWVCEDDGRCDGTGVRLIAVRTSYGDNSVSVHFSSHNLTVTMIFKLARILPDLLVGFDLVASDGTVVFRSYQCDQPEHTWPRQVLGMNCWSCTIPAGILHDGSYYISPRLALYGVRCIAAFDAVLRIEVIRDHSTSVRGREARPGVIAPVLDWKVLSHEDREMRQLTTFPR